MAKKMPARLVALSASAVAAIYLAGLVSTQPAADSVTVASAGANTAGVASSAPILIAAVAATATPMVAPTGVPTTAATPPPAATATATTSTAASPSTYANGTFSGSGTSRFGNVNVSVSVSNGKIANAQITSVTTKYPASRIASLPGQVVQNQTANVNLVTGATSSSQAFKQAVQQALAQAQALAASSTAAAG